MEEDVTNTERNVFSSVLCVRFQQRLLRRRSAEGDVQCDRCCHTDRPSAKRDDTVQCERRFPTMRVEVQRLRRR